MVIWLDVKKERGKPNMMQVMSDMKNKKNRETYKEDYKKLKNEMREKEKETHIMRRRNEGIQSYLKSDQFEYFNSSVNFVFDKVCQYTIELEDVEKRLISINKKRYERLDRKKLTKQ